MALFLYSVLFVLKAKQESCDLPLFIKRENFVSEKSLCFCFALRILNQFYVKMNQLSAVVFFTCMQFIY